MPNDDDESPVTVVSYGCETWSLTFRKEHRLKTFEKRALREMFRPNKEKKARGWRKLPKEVINDLYTLLHQILLGFSDNTERDGHIFWRVWGDKTCKQTCRHKT